MVCAFDSVFDLILICFHSPKYKLVNNCRKKHIKICTQKLNCKLYIQ